MSRRVYFILSFSLFLIFISAVGICTFLSSNRSGVYVYTSKSASNEQILTGNNSYSSVTSVSDLPAGTLINISTADTDELCLLPGIGPSLAAAIIDYRTENGNFTSSEDVMLVPGIGEGRYAAIADYICTD